MSSDIRNLRKPPLGLKPKWLHDEQRVTEIVAAIQRYLKAGRKIPMQWIEEYNEFQEKRTT